MSIVYGPFAMDGIRVGHWTHPTGATGCTVVIPDEPMPAVADVRGGAPGTRELALLDQGRLVRRVDAVLLTGGSALGLAAAQGVVDWLRQQGRGFPTASIRVPIVPAAVLFDLVGPDPVWPGPRAGAEAAANAVPEGWLSGRVGAGSGATVGKLFGPSQASPGGLGAARVSVEAGTVAALMAVNAVGDVIEPDTGTILAGVTFPGEPARYMNAETMVLQGSPRAVAGEGTNTVIGVVVVDATVDRDAMSRIAVAAHDGITRAIRPAHTIFDGDTIFVLARGEGSSEPGALLQLATAAERAVARAIVAAVAPPRGQE